MSDAEAEPWRETLELLERLAGHATAADRLYLLGVTEDELTPETRELLAAEGVTDWGLLATLRHLAIVRTALKEAERQLMTQAIAAGGTWDELADALGVGVPAVVHRWRQVPEGVRERHGQRPAGQ